MFGYLLEEILVTLQSGRDRILKNGTPVRMIDNDPEGTYLVETLDGIELTVQPVQVTFKVPEVNHA